MTVFLVKITLAWGFFALLYMLLLRQETFFRANRAYLLSTATLGILLALPVDWLTIWQSEITIPAVVLPAVTAGLQQAEATAQAWDWLDYLWVAYWVGASLALLRMLWGLFRIARMVIRGEKEQLTDGCMLVKTQEAKVPFSFFKWVFVPQETQLSESYSGNAMLTHERAHAHDWHSVDVLFVEFFCVVLWFHPLAHWYRKAIRTVHEYLADAEASRQTDIKQYGLLLIRQAQSGVSLAFVNHFFQSPLKQRLIMLTRNASPALRAWKYGLVLPVFAFLLLFACQKTAQEPDLKTVSDQALPLQALADKAYELYELEQMPQFPGGQEALMKFFSDNIKYPEAARRDSAEGTVVAIFVIDEKGKVSDVVKPENANPAWRQDFIDEAVRVMNLMPDWKPGIKNGKPVRVQFSLPIRFKLR